MIQLTRDNGDTILVNPESITMVMPIRGGRESRLIGGHEVVNVRETVEQIAHMIGVTAFPPIEIKAGVGIPLSGEEAAGMPDAEVETYYEAMTRTELDDLAANYGLDISGAKNKAEVIAIIKANIKSLPA